MNYLGKFISNFRHVYNEINPATLTGAIDIVVVEQPDGTFTCSPFHVRFGKIGVLRSREKIVEIEINGEPVQLHMKLGESGEAFFVEEISEEDDIETIPPHLACSPIPDDEDRKTIEYAINLEQVVPKTFCAETVDGATQDFQPLKFRPIEDSPPRPQMRKRRRKKSVIKRKVKDETKKLGNTFGSCDLPAPTYLIDNDDRSQEQYLDNDLHFFSDTDASPSSNCGEVKYSCAAVQSDTEYELQQRARDSAVESLIGISAINKKDLNNGSSDHQFWRWGELPTPPARRNSLDSNDSKLNLQEASKKQEAANQRSMLANMLGFMKKTKHIRHNSSENGGIYLADLCTDQLDPKVLELYLYNQTPPRQEEVKVSDEVDDDDVESGRGASLSHSPTSMDREGPKSIDSDFDEKFHQNSPCEVSVSLCGELDSLNGNDIIEEKFSKHQISYEEFTCDFNNLVKNPNLVVRINKKFYSCQTALPHLISIAAYQKLLPQNEYSEAKVQAENTKGLNRGYTSWFNWSRASKDTKSITPIEGNINILKNDSNNLSEQLIDSNDINECLKSEIDGKIDNELEPSNNINYIQRQRCYSSTDSELELETTKLSLKSKDKNDICRKTLRLTSEQIAKLNLREGSNEIVFSVTTAYQGTSHCKCFLFKWRYDDKIVISDIDGTITKSDVLGHILPIVGKDWAQSGVAKLFTKIKDNGYKLLYLSARAIGQSRVTRDYLKSIKQEDLSLPEGPVLLNPTSLLNAFHREVIEKKPEEFKISCLKDIQALFPTENKPFYAGYGNKINDVWSYQAIGIPISRIFTINHRGELKHELTQTFQSSYTYMSTMVDEMFPVLPMQELDYNQFIYWRDPVPDFN
ncbi:phosphatidate phosphatase LPIN3 isoform X2 [Acyrthosiphon pisum]|uniref:phosphatidate phosphatase n=1 Tax=Acyrthosiphon pisum TaxID=7029 RepID=A0A8R1X0G5_ACYPI|nr:phosphatidate phosphatase LPIN3 isoform X2 [Acyrthosiphon pisum]|eukprot:XP_008178722.1 PREDICTED: phosphatidate phosphatase LPIN3 isoform X2 [Acyrthosiphon pisum]